MQKILIRNRELIVWSFGVSLIVLVFIFLRWRMIAVLAPLKLLFDALIFPVIITAQSIHIKTKSIVSTAFLILLISSANFLLFWWLGGMNFNDGESKIISQLVLRVWLILQGVCTLAYLFIAARKK